MGLDLFAGSHHVWSHGYSMFGVVRDALADTAWDGRDRVNWSGTDESWTSGDRWETEPLPEDPLVALMCHADDYGVLPHPALGPIADRVEALLPLVTDATWNRHLSIDDTDTAGNPEEARAEARQSARELLAALRTADVMGVALEFA